MPSLMTASKQNACLCACLASFLPASLPLRLLFCLQPCICRYLFFMPATMPTCLFAYHPALMPASKPTVLPASLLGTCLPVCMLSSTPTCLFANQPAIYKVCYAAHLSTSLKVDGNKKLGGSGRGR
jgi:hypothetical protein